MVKISRFFGVKIMIQSYLHFLIRLELRLLEKQSFNFLNGIIITQGVNDFVTTVNNPQHSFKH